jgi:hypothetical protein
MKTAEDAFLPSRHLPMKTRSTSAMARLVTAGCALALALLAAPGCATAPTAPEPSKVISPADAAWVRNREAYYSNLGWSSLDARYQAEQDLQLGKSSPVEHRHMGRRVPPAN